MNLLDRTRHTETPGLLLQQAAPTKRLFQKQIEKTWAPHMSLPLVPLWQQLTSDHCDGIADLEHCLEQEPGHEPIDTLQPCETF